MGTFTGELYVNDGIVIVADISTTADNEPNIIKINNHNAAVILDDLKAGKQFCEDNLKKCSSDDYGFDEIVDTATKALKDPNGKHHGKIFDIAIVGYTKDLIQRPIYEFVSYAKEVKVIPHELTQKIMFAIDANLGTFLVTKVYSNYMPLNTAINLMGYVAMQYHTIYHTGKEITIAAISKDGFKLLSDQEMKEILTKGESIDLQIRKDCSNFFVSNVNVNSK